MNQVAIKVGSHGIFQPWEDWAIQLGINTMRLAS